VLAQGDLFAVVHSVNPATAYPSVQTFDEILAKTAMIARAVMRLFSVCFGFALLLAVGGTYALMARAIGRRKQEMGIRRALGATESALARLLLAQSGRQLGIGVVFALPLMIATAIGFASFVDVGIVASAFAAIGVCAAIVGAVLGASWIPARRVLSVPPREALWSE